MNRPTTSLQSSVIPCDSREDYLSICKKEMLGEILACAISTVVVAVYALMSGNILEKLAFAIMRINNGFMVIMLLIAANGVAFYLMKSNFPHPSIQYAAIVYAPLTFMMQTQLSKIVRNRFSLPKIE